QALVRVDEHEGAGHVQEQQEAGDGEPEPGDQRGAAEQLDERGVDGGGGRERHAEVVERAARGGDARLDLLPAVCHEHDAHAEPGEDRRDVVDRPCAHAIDSFGAGGYGPYPTESMTSAGWVARTYQVKQGADVRSRKITRCRSGGGTGEERTMMSPSFPIISFMS